MEGIYVQRSNDKSASFENGGTGLQLITRFGDTEVMLQELKPGNVIWLATADDPSLVEFFYLLNGKLKICMPDGPVFLSSGDSFMVQGLREEVRIENEGYAQMLYITSQPMFDFLCGFMGDLNELLRKAEEKDHYTYNHGRKVMEYTLKLSEEMGYSPAAVDALAVPSLFHDVGKVFIPDEVLNKPGKLTPEEFEYIKRHPTDSRRLLEGKFGKDIAFIAECHHERMDGTGYPNGLKGDEIPPESRIIAVADCFHAMTSDRSYKKAKTFIEAVEEMAGLLDKYDEKVVDALRKLVQDGIINANDP